MSIEQKQGPPRSIRLQAPIEQKVKEYEAIHKDFNFNWETNKLWASVSGVLEEQLTKPRKGDSNTKL